MLKPKGGLVIFSVRLRNYSMPSCWWGRAYSQRSRGWNKLLSECYGPCWNYDLASIDVNKCSPIVKRLINLKSSPTAAPVFNSSEFKWRVMSGDKMMFWVDWWVGDMAFRVKFPDLYLCSATRHMIVKNFFSVWKNEGSDPSL